MSTRWRTIKILHKLSSTISLKREFISENVIHLFTWSFFIIASNLSCSASFAFLADSSASFFQASQACLAWAHDSSHDANFVLAAMRSSLSRWISLELLLRPKGEDNWGEPSDLGEWSWAASGSNTEECRLLPLTNGLARYGLEPYGTHKMPHCEIK